MLLSDPILLPTRLRSVTVTLVLAATVGIATASAQTVIVRSAAPGAPVELTMNGGTAVTATADSNGDATLAVPARAAEDDVQMHVDVCGNLVRVVVVSRGVQPAAAAPNCTRTDFPSTFLMRAVTTFVVDISEQTAVVHLSQGPPPPEWVSRGPIAHGRIAWSEPSTGLAVSAGVGFSTFSNAVTVACGTVTPCDSSNLGGTVTLGAEYWIKKFVAAQFAYLKPGDVTANGGDTFTFDSRMQSRMVLIGAKAGTVTGPVRIYGQGGLNHHEATTTVTETIDTVTTTLAQKSTGWSWFAGGGAEAWFSRFVGIYGELQIVKLSAKPEGGGEGGVDDRATFFMFGVRARLGR
jgi:hypothetical protein